VGRSEPRCVAGFAIIYLASNYVASLVFALAHPEQTLRGQRVKTRASSFAEAHGGLTASAFASVISTSP
jgi:hypothetical protein